MRQFCVPWLRQVEQRKRRQTLHPASHAELYYCNKHAYIQWCILYCSLITTWYEVLQVPGDGLKAHARAPYPYTTQSCEYFHPVPLFFVIPRMLGGGEALLLP